MGLESWALPCPELPTTAGRPRAGLSLPGLSLLIWGTAAPSITPLQHLAYASSRMVLGCPLLGLEAPLRAGAIPDSLLYVLELNAASKEPHTD